jgi:hypothetical protein
MKLSEPVRAVIQFAVTGTCALLLLGFLAVTLLRGDGSAAEALGAVGTRARRRGSKPLRSSSAVVVACVRRTIALALLAGSLVAPVAAHGATVEGYGPDPDPTGGDDFPPGVSVKDPGHQHNDLELRVSRRAVLVVERGRHPLVARHGCRQRSSRVVICRVRADAEATISVDAGGGDDVVRSRCTAYDVQLYGEGGNDRLFAGSCGVWMWGGNGNDTLVGGRYGDELRGGAGADRLIGGAGGDVLYGDGFWRHRGNDSLDGGGGRDTAAWDERSDGIRADLRRGIAVGPRDRDTLRRIENLAGTAGNDLLAGNRGPNRLLGTHGRDLLIGRQGNDLLDGGTASIGYTDENDRHLDHFRCGAGRDKVRYPDRALLPVDCERMEGDYLLFWGETLPARPPPAGRHAVKVPTNCDIEQETCRRRVVIRAGRRTIGRRALVTVRRNFFRVRLTAAARRKDIVTVVVQGYDSSPGEGRTPYRFSWRLACRGAPRRDVCRIGAR